MNSLRLRIFGMVFVVVAVAIGTVLVAASQGNQESVRGLSKQGYKILLDIVLSSDEPPRIREVPYTFRTRTRGESKLDSSVVLRVLLAEMERLDTWGRWERAFASELLGLEVRDLPKAEPFLKVEVIPPEIAIEERRSDRPDPP